MRPTLRAARGAALRATLLAAFALPAAAPAQPAGPPLRVGDRVEIRSGDGWYPTEVLELGEGLDVGKVKITYGTLPDGSPNYQWVAVGMLRRRGEVPPSPPPPDGPPAPPPAPAEPGPTEPAPAEPAPTEPAPADPTSPEPAPPASLPAAEEPAAREPATQGLAATRRPALRAARALGARSVGAQAPGARPPVFRAGDAVEVKSRIDTTWARGRVVETSDRFPDVYKVQLDGQALYLATSHHVDRLRRPGERERPYLRPALPGSHWLQTSVTTARGTVETRATVSVSFWPGGRWTVTTPVGHGSGVSILGRGTYHLTGSRLVMTRDGGAPYGDFDVRWDDAARSVTLVYRDGGGSMRLLSQQGR